MLGCTGLDLCLDFLAYALNRQNTPVLSERQSPVLSQISALCRAAHGSFTMSETGSIGREPARELTPVG